MSALPLIEGPFGFPLPDRAACTVATLLKRLPRGDDHAYRHALLTRAPTEVNSGERSDVSWISTEAVDRVGEVVLARGMDDSQFRLNPIVTLSHDYSLPPVGRCLWRRRARDGDLIGIKAKTLYPPRPDHWPGEATWLPDQVFALVQAGLLRGKSIGFLPLRVHTPDAAERCRQNWPDTVHRVIDSWLLLEYSCVCLPANQHALVEVVSKGQLQLPVSLSRALGLKTLAPTVSTPTLVEQLDRLDLPRRVAALVQAALERARGRI